MKRVPLTKGKIALIDDEDFEIVSQLKWYANEVGNSTYALAFRGGKGVLMHRLLLGTPGKMKVDHKDGDGLNNQKSNIRLCTTSQNGMNRRPSSIKGKTSRFKGVTWEKYENKWGADLYIKGKHISLGNHEKEVEAARSYNEGALKFFGEFARLNII